MPLCMLCPTMWSSKKKRLNSSREEDRHGPPRFSIRGNPSVTNIGVNKGVNNVTNINNNTNYGGAHGLERMETFVSFAAHHNSAEQDPDRRCHPGTRKFILECIQNWIDNPSAPERIAWLHGPAGAGKSAIAQTIAHSNMKEKVAATFFFYRSDPSRNDGNRLFTTLAWQLAFSIPAVKPFIVDALEKQPNLPRTNVETQFDQLIVRPFQQLRSQIPQSLHALPVIIIDGVDECADEKLQQRFLKVIGNAVGDGCLPLRFLICSRPEADIQGTIDRFQPSPLFIDLAKLDDANHDIEKYLKDEFFRIASERDVDPTLWPGEQAIQEVVFKSSSYFIFAATVIRCVGDPDNSPEAQLDIILGLKPIRSTSPFALLDELYTEILRRQLDRDFLKTFLALLVGRSSVEIMISDTNLADDDVTLMKISKKELHMKLRRMRSLLSFDPHIDVYHRSFIDFLVDPSRSNQYHVSREGGIMQYLELIVDWIVQYAARVIEQPDYHTSYHFRPQFVNLLDEESVDIPLPVEGWQRALQPLLHLQDKLLRLPNFNSTWDILPCKECFAFYTMRCLLLRLAILQGFSHATAESAEQYASSTLLTLTVTERNIFQTDLDYSLSSLLTWLRNSKSVESSLTTPTIDLVRSVLCFDYAEIAAKVLSVADAQELVDIIDRATRLALKLFAKAPVLPRSLFLEMEDSFDFGNPNVSPSGSMEALLRSAFMVRILDRNFCVSSFRICKEAENFRFWDTNYIKGSIKEWREWSKPRSVTRLKAMLAVAKAFQYFHSLGIVLDHEHLSLGCIVLDSKFCVRIRFLRVLSDLEERWTSDFKANIFSFGCFFYETYFKVQINDYHRREFKRSVIVERPSKPKIRDDAWQLIQRCCAEDPNSRPTIDEVVQEMESWKLV
ncbi:hypothetical protein JOM56_009133 [Amanita muscaria]